MSVDKLVDSTQLDADLTSVANAIRTKGGTSAQLAFPAGFVQAIGDIPSGGSDDGIPILKDVVFIDYDGTIVEQYTKAEFLALDSLPSNPSHSGLTAQGWNWTLADAKTYVTANGMLVVGQNYTTSDGKTRVYITVNEPLVGSVLYLQLTTSVKGGVTIDWGDGTSQATTGNADAKTKYSHSYSASGEYVITFTRTDGTYQLGKGTGGNAYDGFLSKDASASLLRLIVRKVEIGDYVTDISMEAFDGCSSLSSISISRSVTVFSSGTRGNAFRRTGIKALVIPSGTTALVTLFSSCQTVQFISIPKTVASYSIVDGEMDRMLMLTLPEVASIPARVFYGMHGILKACAPGTYTAISSNYTRACRLLKSVVIPASVTSIAQHALTEMDNVREYHFLSTSPPALASTSNMFSLNTGTKIYVPYSADHSILNAYKTATNWTSFASYIEEEPQ